MEKKRLGTGRVAFLARIDVLREKIKAGHTIAMLHDEYKNDMGISYGQFLNYVNRYIRGKKEEKIPEKSEPKIKERKLSPVEILDSPIDKKDIF